MDPDLAARVEGKVRRKPGHAEHLHELPAPISCSPALFYNFNLPTMAPASDRTESDPRRKRPGRVPRVEEAISNPGAVKINVTGAFIVDDDDRSRSPVEADGVHYENKDIRLPHHTGVVSHVAVDVSP